MIYGAGTIFLATVLVDGRILITRNTKDFSENEPVIYLP